MTRTAHVAVAGHAYDVVIGHGLVEVAGARIAPLLRRPRLAVVTDEIVDGLHGRRLEASLADAGIDSITLVIPPGEQTKSFAGLEALSDRLLALELERGDMIVAFGGGVVGDLTGFAAAIFKRGMDFVQVPSTLLAQVDSSVGGKTAIDTPRGKNLIGAFHQPRLVLADLALLASLPDREMRCGYAEVIKIALMGDADFFSWLETNGPRVLAREQDALTEAVTRSVEMKAAMVARDERDGGARALLNLGHTFAHALEAERGYGDELKHGEAVAVGCALAFRFSARLGLCPDSDAARASRAIAAAGLATRLDELAGAPLSAGALAARMAHDKKATGGRLNFILARGIGEAFVANDVDALAVTRFLAAEGARP